MPKRITRSNRESNSIFMSGFNCGVNAIFFALQITKLRKDKNKTIAEVATELGLSEKLLTGLESGHCECFMSLDLDQINSIAKYFDVAVEVAFKAGMEIGQPLADKIAVPTFEEEFHAR